MQKIVEVIKFSDSLQMERGFRSVHVQGVELMHMGQQSMGHYPVHFHMNGDVDQKGGYDPPTYVKDLSIHHSFSRCVTIHGSNGLLVSFRVPTDLHVEDNFNLYYKGMWDCFRSFTVMTGRGFRGCKKNLRQINELMFFSAEQDKTIPLKSL